MLKNIKRYIQGNKSVVIISLAYSALLLSVITWGIPNEQHPFTYHMDEWHQLQAVKATFKHWTPNTEGAAHGTLFHFFLTGIYLIPFYLLGIIDPFVIKSGLSAYEMQTKLFEVLRLNTLLYGVLSLFVLNEIVKKYFKINPTITLVFFTFTPVWIYLSNYFKYDIALLFWIVAAIYFILQYGSNQTLRNYIIAGIACSLALAVKLSAIPLLVIYILSFFIFSLGRKKNYAHLFIGIVSFLVVFLLFGIPDVLLGKANYGDFLSSNLIDASTITNNFNLEFQPWWLYILLGVMPINFGHGFFVIFAISIAYWFIVLLKAFRDKKISARKNELFLFISFFIFLASLWQLKIGANGNRLLVLLPFLAILTGLFSHQLFAKKFFSKKWVMVLFIVVIIVFQLVESLTVIYLKQGSDVRQSSSVWLLDNIREGSEIGIENIPIYQQLPDIIVKEFYEKQNNPKKDIHFHYEVIDASTGNLPKIVVITNKEYESKYLKKSAKKDLLTRLEGEGYEISKEFKPPQMYYFFMQNELRMNTSGLLPIPTITIYVKEGK